MDTRGNSKDSRDFRGHTEGTPGDSRYSRKCDSRGLTPMDSRGNSKDSSDFRGLKELLGTLDTPESVTLGHWLQWIQGGTSRNKGTSGDSRNHRGHQVFHKV